jgi:hypothetical protein
MDRFIRLAIVAAMSLLAAFTSSQSRGASLSWIFASGDWNTAGDWNPSSVPGPGDDAMIANGGTATISSGVAATCSGLSLGLAGSGTVQLLPGGSLTIGADGEGVGYSSIGLVNQSGGTNSASNVLALGYLNGSNGFYSLSGGLLSAPDEYIGYSGSGSFTQIGGTNSCTTHLILGGSSTANGAYSLGGGLLSAPYEYIGYSGSGSFTQNGGTNFCTAFLDLGAFASSVSGSYGLSGGSLSAPTEYIGGYGSGSFTQSGGTNSCTVNLILGNGTTANGSYSLSGNGSLTAGTETVADGGGGNFTQSGGANAASYLYVGVAGASGSYSLGGGSLAATYEYLGITGTGSFIQSGGNNAVTFLIVGGSLGSGTYNVTGGSLAVSGAIYVGFANPGDIGTFIQSGGTVSINANLNVGGGSSGSYNLSGNGYLNVPSEFIRTPGFTQSGGTNAVTNDLHIISNGSYSLSSSGYLTAPNEYVGDAGNGSFIQTGGTNTTSSSLYVGENGGSGTYTLSGGSLAAAAENVGNLGATGAFAQSGGTNSPSNLILGAVAGSSGSYSLTGGSLATLVETVGNSGSGAFTQSGGTNTIASLLVVGSNAGSNGTYSLSGSGFLAAANEYVGVYGSGAYLQSDGTNSVTVTLEVGYAAGQTGTYSLSGSGVFAAGYEYVGVYGSGAYLQSGGTNFITNTLYLGTNNGGTGSYNLSGGSLAAVTEYVGGAPAGGSGIGTFTQSGGTNSVAGIMYMAYGNSASGSYNLSGSGYLSAGTISIGPLATFTQTGGTVGPGTMQLAGTFNYGAPPGSGAFNGRLINRGTFLYSTSFYAGQGIENDVVMIVPAGFAIGTSGGSSSLDNEGTFNLAGGTLAGGQSAGSGGPIVNNGLITGYGFLTSGAGITNNLEIAPIGGVLTISAGTGGMINNGTITLTPSYQLSLSGGTLTNLGNINLNSSTFAGSGLLNNTTGVVSGPGTIAIPFANLLGGVLSVPAGATTLASPLVNAGQIQVAAVSGVLTGGSIANLDLIEGFGMVTNAINNTGTINSLGGPLTLSGPVTNTGTIEALSGTLTISGSLQNNNAGGLLATDAGSKFFFSSGMAVNLGIINLTGGIFDNNSFALSNSARITGYGTFRSGGLTNYSVITFSGATSTVNGAVTNASGGSISVSYNPAIFTGNVINNGYVKTTSTTATWAGGFTNNGTYHSDPAQNYFASLANGATGLLLGAAGDGFFITGPLATNAGQIDLGGTSTMVVNSGTGVLSQSAGMLEMGAGATLSAGSVEITGGVLLADGPAASINANLIYDSPSPSTYQGILAGTGNSLTVNGPSAVLVLSGSNTYQGGTDVFSGTLVAISPAAIRDGTNLNVGIDAGAIFGPVVSGRQVASIASAVSPVPEPGALALLAAATTLVLWHRWRRLRTQ